MNSKPGKPCIISIYSNYTNAQYIGPFLWLLGDIRYQQVDAILLKDLAKRGIFYFSNIVEKLN